VHDVREFALRPSKFFRPAAVGRGAAAESAMPIQDLGHALVSELARVGWQVDDLHVSTATYGRGTNLLTTVKTVSGHRPEGAFALHFRGSQGLEEGYYRTTGLNTAILPSGLAATFYADGSRSLKRYQGTGDWSEAGEYGDGWETPPNAGPAAYRKAASETRALVEALISELRSLPDAPGHDEVDEAGFDPNLRRLTSSVPVPVPADFPTLYAWERIDDLGRSGLQRRHPERRQDEFVLAGNGLRLVSIGHGGGDLPARATDGFSYASADPSDRPIAPGWTPRTDVLPIEVRLSALNEIYVVDADAYRAAREEVEASAAEAGRDVLTSSEIAEPHRAVAWTMVPASEYAGGFGQPLYLIGRQLHEDEARPMAGPVRVVAADDRIGAWMRDEETGIDLPLFAPVEAEPWAVRDASRTARHVAEIHGVRLVEIGLEQPAPAVPVF
jgi:hypothetical protein